MNATEKNHAKDNAVSNLESIVEMVTALDTEDEDAREGAIQAINEDPLSVEVRSDWHTPGEVIAKNTEYRILLSWGGPACHIIGELNEHNEPETAVIEYQDWGTPWTALEDVTDDQTEALLTYARQFYFEEV